MTFIEQRHIDVKMHCEILDILYLSPLCSVLWVKVLSMHSRLHIITNYLCNRFAGFL